MMQSFLASWWGVLGAAILTALTCILVTQVLVYYFFQGQDLAAALWIAPFISSVTGFPVSFFIWSQVRSNILLSNRLRNLVNRDRLTGVATRDLFFATMESSPKAKGVALMVDIDHFKKVNDTYGHFVGDAVIRHVAQSLADTCRSDDIVCRFGGEEFLVFLDDCSMSEGRALAERIRENIADTPVVSDGCRVSATVSIGLCEKSSEDDIAKSIRCADAALYKAKQSGRNQSVSSREVPQQVA